MVQSDHTPEAWAAYCRWKRLLSEKALPRGNCQGSLCAVALSYLRSRTPNYKNAKRLSIALSSGKNKQTHFKRNHWPLNSRGLNCTGPPICGFKKNKCLPRFPSAVGSLQMQRADFVHRSTPWVLVSVLRSFWNQSLVDPVKGFTLVGSQNYMWIFNCTGVGTPINPPYKFTGF